MRAKYLLYILSFVSFLYFISMGGAGCAQIGAPTGGPKDTIAPKLVDASPEDRTTNFKGNKISLNFDKYVEVDDAFNNVLVSPYPKNNPQVSFKLRTVTIKLKDTLQPNTTYFINFGNAIRDVNEANVLRNFSFTFSTGNTIDSLSLGGKVIMAETGKVDSTIMAMLYRNAVDSSVLTRRPDYMAKLAGDGSFNFYHLPPGNYRVYALKDGDGGKTYNSKKELFAFLDKELVISKQNEPVMLYAYAQEKIISTPAPDKEKKLKYTTSIGERQDLLSDLELSFNKRLKKFDTLNALLTDTNYIRIPYTVSIDSNRKNITIHNKWIEDAEYRLIINKDAFADTAGLSLSKTDTIHFKTRRESDYGNLVIRFTKLDFSQHPVLQFVQGDEIKQSVQLTSNEWSQKLFRPGEYEMRILFDTNNNGIWDAGNYSLRRQPERVIVIPQKLVIRPSWDNEKDIGPL